VIWICIFYHRPVNPLIEDGWRTTRTLVCQYAVAHVGEYETAFWYWPVIYNSVKLSHIRIHLSFVYICCHVFSVTFCYFPDFFWKSCYSAVAHTVHKSQTLKSFLCQMNTSVSIPILSLISLFLGRLFWVDLLKWVSNVRTSVHPQKVSLISMKFSMFVEFNDWCTTVCSIRSKVKVTSPSGLEILPFSNAISSTVYNGSRQLTTDS